MSFAYRPFRDVLIETWRIHSGNGHIRLHRIETDSPLETVEGSFAESLRALAYQQRNGYAR